MRKFRFLLLFILIILISITKGNNESLIKRKLYDGPSDLKIYLDLFNFNETFPSDKLGDNRDLFINSMKKAKNILEQIFLIEADNGPEAGLDIKPEFKEFLGISYWDDNIFIEGQKLKVDEYNIFIVFKFVELNNVDMYSKIAFTYANEMPLIGLVTINKNIDNSKLTSDYLTPLFLQQFIKILGFQITINLDLESDFDGAIKAEIEENEETDEEGLEDLIVRKVWVNTENVINYAQKYFDCDRIEEIELELDNYNNVYWPSRLFLGDIMTKFDNYEEKFISNFTLALLEDTGNLHVKKEFSYTGGLMRFGKHKGCDFFFGDCHPDDVRNDIIFSNEFYLPTDTSKYPEPSCSSSRLGKTIYTLHSIREEDTIPESGYTNGGYTGLSQTKYCPIGEYNYDPIYDNIVTGFCSDLTLQKDESIHEEFGNDSFCILRSSLILNEFKSVCYKMSCSAKSLTIKIGNDYIVCPREGGQIQPDGFQGYLLCPDYNLICTTDKLCNNMEDCFEKRSIEKEDTLDYDYIIKTTQNSNIYKSLTPELNEGWELSTDGFCPELCMICNSEKKCQKCKPGYKVYNPEENICSEIVPNCKEYINDICDSCKDGYFLAKEDNGTLVCQSDSLSAQYFQFGSDKFKIKCHNNVGNCFECADGGVCTKCSVGYELIKKLDNTFICGDLSTELYYHDTIESNYKLCSEYNSYSNCEKCVIDEENNFICKECLSNYILAHDSAESVSCKLLSSLNSKYYKLDDKNYFLCSNIEYHDIPNCAECSTRNKCSNCNIGYVTANAGTLCLSNIDLEQNLYYRDPLNNDIYYLCEESLPHCTNCISQTECTQCQTDYILDAEKKCISQEDINSQLYFVDEDTGKYLRCSIIDNCIKCLSRSECILCQNGFELNNNICKKIEINDNDDDKLSTGAIIGIVFGCLGFLLIVAAFIYFFVIKKMKGNIGNNENTVFNEEKIKSEKIENNEKNKQKEDEINLEETEKKNVVNIYNTKRSINNK